MVNERRSENEEEYHHNRKEAHKIIRNRKKLCITNVKESIEEDQKYNNIRKMYQTINEFKKGYQHKFTMIRNKKKRKEMAMNTKETAEIQKEYSENLLNTEEQKELIKTGNREINEVEVEELNIDVKKAMRYLKNYKVAGTDGKHSELRNTEEINY